MDSHKQFASEYISHTALDQKQIQTSHYAKQVINF